MHRLGVHIEFDRLGRSVDKDIVSTGNKVMLCMVGLFRISYRPSVIPRRVGLELIFIIFEKEKTVVPFGSTVRLHIEFEISGMGIVSAVECHLSPIMVGIIRRVPKLGLTCEIPA